MNVTILIKTMFENIIKPMYLEFLRTQKKLKKTTPCTKERARALNEQKIIKNKLYNILGTKNPKILKDRVTRLYNGLHGYHYDLTDNDIEVLEQKFLYFKPKETIKINFLNKLNNLIIIQYVDNDKLFNIALFETKKDMLNFFRVLESCKKDKKRQFINLCRDTQKVPMIANIKSYEDLFNKSSKNPIVKKAINSYWELRNLVLSKNEQKKVKTLKKHPKKDLTITKIIDEFDSYNTVQFVYNEYIHHNNFYDVLNDIDVVLKNGIREDIFDSLKKLKIYMLEKETDLFYTENNSIEQKTKIEDYL